MDLIERSMYGGLLPVGLEEGDLLLMGREEREEFLRLLEAKLEGRRRRRMEYFYPEGGPIGREKYGKHMEFFAAGLVHRERLFIAANRVGKSEAAGGYELTLHLTGLYPGWWVGRRFEHPVSAWASGTTNQTTRDIIQAKMCGPLEEMGTGLIPGHLMGKTTRKLHAADALETVLVKHVSGGWSDLGFKSYEQGRVAFEGTEKHVVWLDEEPPMSVYTECLTRTMTVGGLVMVTFTPLKGLSEVVLSFLPEGRPGGLEEVSGS